MTIKNKNELILSLSRHDEYSSISMCALLFRICVCKWMCLRGCKCTLRARTDTHTTKEMYFFFTGNTKKTKERKRKEKKQQPTIKIWQHKYNWRVIFEHDVRKHAQLIQLFCCILFIYCLFILRKCALPVRSVCLSSLSLSVCLSLFLCRQFWSPFEQLNSGDFCFNIYSR